MWFLEESFIRDSAAWIGMEGPVVEALVRAAGEVDRMPHLRDAAGRARELIYEQHEERQAVLRAMPRFDSEGEGGRLLYALVYLSALPAVRELNARRGIDEGITRRTLKDLELWIHEYGRRHGEFGFEELDWPVWHFTGRLFELGRLQFQVTHSNWDVPGLGKGEPVLGVHIPATGPLEDAACEASFERAMAFFPCYFPEHRFIAFTCESWMMDPQLGQYLPVECNLMRFQRRFSLYPLAESLGWQLYERVLGWNVRDVADAAPPRTTLQRAVIEHVRRGGQWHGGLGIRLRQV